MWKCILLALHVTSPPLPCNIPAISTKGSATLNYYIALHYITLHYMTLHCITLHYITLHYITEQHYKQSEEGDRSAACISSQHQSALLDLAGGVCCRLAVVCMLLGGLGCYVVVFKVVLDPIGCCIGCSPLQGIICHAQDSKLTEPSSGHRLKQDEVPSIS